MTTALAFELPPALEAREPIEARGLERDQVRLLVAREANGAIEHRTFSDLPELLDPGDALVINVSATLPAAIAARRSDGSAIRVHFATRAPELGQSWRIVELRSPHGELPVAGRPGERIELSGGAALQLVARYASGPRLLLARFEGAENEQVEEYLARHGEPIRYGYVPQSWPLAAYQTVYAKTPGSAEMPSAGRPFTAELITRLVARGVLFAPLTLHTGVSSPEQNEPPFPEQFEVSESTARLINGADGRVIAVGTTAVRALETAAGPDGRISPKAGWTGLVIGPERPVRAVEGLITGWHEPEASHLEMLAAIAGPELLERSYAEALEGGYLWHEFGDSHLILH